MTANYNISLARVVFVVIQPCDGAAMCPITVQWVQRRQTCWKHGSMSRTHYDSIFVCEGWHTGENPSQIVEVL